MGQGRLVSPRLSGFLRFLHRVGHLSDDFSRSMIHPTLYEFENIPSVLKPEEITQILKATRRDRSPRGRRDFAILMLLAMYGLRPGEVVRLALDDIDWRAETIVIRHSKVRRTTVLPLLPTVGAALLAYLRSGRPKTTAREIFIRMSAPLQGFSQKSVLHALVSRRIVAAGVRASRQTRSTCIPPRAYGWAFARRSADEDDQRSAWVSDQPVDHHLLQEGQKERRLCSQIRHLLRITRSC